MMNNNFNAQILDKLNEESNIRIRHPSLIANAVNVDQIFDNELQVSISDNFINSTATSLIPIVKTNKIDEANIATEKIYNLFVTPIVVNNVTDISANILSQIKDVIAINDHKAKTFVFDSEADLQSKMNDTVFVEELNLGDIFFIKDSLLPDGWWDGEKIQRINDEKTQSYVFTNQTALLTQLNEDSFREQLNKGDIFFLESKNEPDYWWDGTQLQKFEIEWPYTIEVKHTPPTINNEKIITFVI